MNCFLRYAVLSLWLALTLSCARLPEYARPRIVEVHEQRETLVTGFPYRPLTPADFRATTTEHAERIGAHAAIQIRVTPDSRFRVTRGDFNGQGYFFGSIEYLAFEAVMLPDRSWWNPKITNSMRGYVLQHEQIHFALTELAARQLTRDTHKWASDVLMIEQTPKEVLAELNRQINDRINAAMKANIKRHAQFDEDTSLFYSPKWQRWWSESVEDELKKVIEKEAVIRKSFKHLELSGIKSEPPARSAKAQPTCGRHEILCPTESQKDAASTSCGQFPLTGAIACLILRPSKSNNFPIIIKSNGR